MHCGLHFFASSRPPNCRSASTDRLLARRCAWNLPQLLSAWVKESSSRSRTRTLNSSYSALIEPHSHVVGTGREGFGPESSPSAVSAGVIHTMSTCRFSITHKSALACLHSGNLHFVQMSDVYTSRNVRDLPREHRLPPAKDMGESRSPLDCLHTGYPFTLTFRTWFCPCSRAH